MTGAAPRGFGERIGGGERAAVLVIDMSLGFTDPESPLACDLDETVPAIARVVEAAREADAPVIYTTVAYRPEDEATAAAFLGKIPVLRTLSAGSRWCEIDPRIAPSAGEPVLTKLFASGFFGTDLAERLRDLGVDAVIVTGASTSGCVRATVVDALQHGFHAIVPSEAVGDRDAAAHEANLHDIDVKYGDVVPLKDALGLLGRPGRRPPAPSPR
jgi:maleamate amidohydrolase